MQRKYQFLYYSSFRNLGVLMNSFSIIRLLTCVYFFTSATLFYADIKQDLDFDAIFTAIDYTHSNYGKQALHSLLDYPLADALVLQSRQTIIAHIAQDTKLYAQLNHLLHTFARQESHFEQMMQTPNDIETVALKPFYFSSSTFASWNYSPAGLELGHLAYMGNLCSSMAQHALMFAIFTWCLDEEHVCPSHPAKNNHCSDHHHHDHDCTDHTHHHHHAPDHAHYTFTHSLKKLARSPEFKYVFQWWHTIAQIQELYSIQAIVRNNLKCLQEIQIQLMGIARGLRIVEDMYSTVKNHPEITTQLTHYDALEDICTATNISQKLTLLMHLLQSPTFKGRPSVFSRMGIILAAYRLMQEVGSELQPALMAVGEIDAYLSCAHLLHNNQCNKLHYSFAHYDTASSTPLIVADNFWHPLVAPHMVELNSITLGLHNAPRNIVLTGPNACGKSTNLKALTLCAYCAQTITVVPAAYYSQTLFKEIYSSIVVSDKILQNKSLFVAELTDAEELLTRVENLHNGEYMLIVLDELFKSTHHEKGQNVAYRLLENLYASPRVITIVSTHFEKLIELADNNNEICANYTVDNFKLKLGIGSPDSAFDIVGKKTRSRLLT